MDRVYGIFIPGISEGLFRVFNGVESCIITYKLLRHTTCDYSISIYSLSMDETPLSRHIGLT
jgi:hypothetical protein